MAGRPRKYTDPFYVAEAEIAAARISAGIVGRGRPSQETLVKLATSLGIDVSPESSADVLSEAISSYVDATLRPLRVLRDPVGKAGKVRKAPTTDRGRKIAQTRRAKTLADKMGVIMGKNLADFEVPTPAKPKRTRAKAV